MSSDVCRCQTRVLDRAARRRYRNPPAVRCSTDKSQTPAEYASAETLHRRSRPVLVGDVAKRKLFRRKFGHRSVSAWINLGVDRNPHQQRLSTTPFTSIGDLALIAGFERWPVRRACRHRRRTSQPQCADIFQRRLPCVPRRRRVEGDRDSSTSRPSANISSIARSFSRCSDALFEIVNILPAGIGIPRRRECADAAECWS